MHLHLQRQLFVRVDDGEVDAVESNRLNTAKTKVTLLI